MLSSISSFIPTNILSSNGDRNKQPPGPPSVSHPEDHGKATAMTDAKKSKTAKKDKVPNENFIIVRPPPSKSNHPLNLQVQLLPPTSRSQGERSSTVDSRRSLDVSSSVLPASQDQNDLSLRRTSSVQSDISTSYSTSVSSFASTSTLSSGRRAIIPLYNLQAHNVMTNLVVDAGTDAKIAKFMKRGIELISLAVLEPTEVWTLPSGTGDPESPRALLHPNQPSHHSRPTTPDPAHTPGSSVASVSSAGLHNVIPPRPEPAEPQPPPAGAKKIFGKLFKKKETTPDSGSETPTQQRTHGRHSSLSSAGASALVPAPLSKTAKRLSHTLAIPASNAVPALNVTSEPPLLGSPVLGVIPTLELPSGEKEGRPAVYVWVVKKWLKGPGTEGILGGLVGKLANKEGSGPGAMGQGVEVRFEWKRGKTSAKKGSKKLAKEKSHDKDADSGSPEPSPPLEPPPRRTKRLSTASVGRQSIASTDDHGDGGEESDPEDSETPWNCVMKMQRRGVPAEDGEGGARLKVATLSPTPHHPKVVGLLKIPFPLPDFEVDSVAMVPRQLKGGVMQGGSVLKAGVGLVLTAEEVKDIVSTTALWLVVRESFGGVGKVTRKGDGWRIRG